MCLQLVDGMHLFISNGKAAQGRNKKHSQVRIDK